MNKEDKDFFNEGDVDNEENRGSEANNIKWKKKKKKKATTKKNEISRISNVIDKSFDPRKDKDEDEEIDAHNLSGNNLETFNMLTLTVNLVIGEAVKSITVLMSDKNKLEALIQRSIAEFNDVFAAEKTLFKLIPDYTKYGLKPSKKTGFPKSDMPCFNSKATIAESNCIQFTLVWKENASDSSIYFIKTQIKEKASCKDCLIF